MRRKPMHNNSGRQNNNGGGQRRHSNGGGGGGGYNNNRPRKNYPQLREKYINQARDALGSGDRVMAEYYFQHADHCYRMMVEEGYRPQTQQQQDNQQQEAAQQGSEPQQQQQQQVPAADESMPSAGALPSFLTMGYTAAAGAANTQQAEANPAQGQWEEN